MYNWFQLQTFSLVTKSQAVFLNCFCYCNVLFQFVFFFTVTCFFTSFLLPFRQPEVPQPKPTVPAPSEVAPVAKSWANTKQGGQGDGKWRRGEASLVDLTFLLCRVFRRKLYLLPQKPQTNSLSSFQLEAIMFSLLLLQQSFTSLGGLVINYHMHYMYMYHKPYYKPKNLYLKISPENVR